MKKTFLLFSLLIMISLGLRVSVNAQTTSKFKGQTLTIFNVEDYISQGIDDSVNLIEKFEKEYDVKVNYYTYDTNETMYNQFKLQKEGTYDLICTSDYMIQKMIKEGLVMPMDNYATYIPNYERYASTALREKLKNMKVPYGERTVNLDEFAVGYMWGTLGIVYDPTCSDTICEDVKSWDVFWNEKYANLISIKNSVRDAFVVGLMHSYSKEESYQKIMQAYLENPTIENMQAYNELVQEIFDFKLDGSTSSDQENLEKIRRVKEELISVKQNIFGFEVDSGKNDIITGKIKMNLAYSGDAVYSIDTARDEAGKRLEYYVPEDGSNIWYDAWTLPKGSNKELAYAFLNFLSDPKNAADNMDYIGYTPYIVGDELFTLTGAWYGATDYLVTSAYLKDDETLVIYENKLYRCIKDKDADLEIYPDNEEYFECLEYSSDETYEEEDMVSYHGKIYNCISADKIKGISPDDTTCWEENKGYDLSHLYGGMLSENRRPIVYASPSSLNELETQYPSEYIIARCAIMNDFGSYNDEVVIAWGQIKAYTNMSPIYIFLSVVLVVCVTLVIVYVVKKRIDYKYKKKGN